MAFSLSLLGTFLVRSGVLTSVHAFATDPQRGLFMLIFLVIVTGGSLTLYAWRAPSIGLGGKFSLFSRESMLLVNNVLLLVAAGTVMLGTLYPLFLDALGLGKISVGPPYFETVFVPLMIPVLLLIAVGPFVSWKDASFTNVSRRLHWFALATLAFAILVLLSLKVSVMVTVGLTLSVWIVVATTAHLVQRLTPPTGASIWKRVTSQPRSYWGMIVAHAGIGVFVFGVTLVKGMETANDASMRIGDSTSVGGYHFTFTAMKKVEGPNYIAAQGVFDVTREAEKIATMHPEKRFYTVRQTPMTEAAIDRGVTRDLYVSLGEGGKDGAWSVRVQHKPFVGWIWGGCLTIALGGFLAASDRRYRIGSRKRARTQIDPVDKRPISAPA
jgi:cytochrome c-type biogenesis protein CcmF